MKFDKSAFNSVVKPITLNLCMAKRETVADHFSSVLYENQLSVESLSQRNRIRLQKKRPVALCPWGTDEKFTFGETVQKNLLERLRVRNDGREISHHQVIRNNIQRQW